MDREDRLPPPKDLPVPKLPPRAPAIVWDVNPFDAAHWQPLRRSETLSQYERPFFAENPLQVDEETFLDPRLRSR